MTTDNVYAKLPDPIEVKGHLVCQGHGEGCGGIMDAPQEKGQTAQQAAMVAEAHGKGLLAQATAAAKSCGKLSPGLKQLVEETLYPRLGWPDILRRFMEHVTRDDYSWESYDRRYISGGLYLPDLWSTSLGSIVVAIDTSGSINNKELETFGAILSDILESTNPEVIYVIFCDDRVQKVEEYTKSDLPLKLEARGRGGTDFRPPFEWVERNGITPTCFIYQTDLYCNDYPPVPEYPVMWVISSNGARNNIPFGESIRLTR